MESGPAVELPGVAGRHLAVDSRGVGLRATWRPARGFVNLSLWRGEQCVENFQLAPDEVSRLVAFLVSRLASAVPSPQVELSLVDDVAAPEIPSAVARRRRIGTAVADVLERTADRLRR